MKVLSMSLDQLVGLAEMHNGWSKGETSVLQLLALFLHLAQLFGCWISNLTSLSCLSSQAIKTSLLW